MGVEQQNGNNQNNGIKGRILEVCQKNNLFLMADCGGQKKE